MELWWDFGPYHKVLHRRWQGCFNQQVKFERVQHLQSSRSAIWSTVLFETICNRAILLSIFKPHQDPQPLFFGPGCHASSACSLTPWRFGAENFSHSSLRGVRKTSVVIHGSGNPDGFHGFLLNHQIVHFN